VRLAPYSSGPSRHWIKSKNVPVVKREAEEDWSTSEREASYARLSTCWLHFFAQSINPKVQFGKFLRVVDEV
jgi:hypothetical protein